MQKLRKLIAFLRNQPRWRLAAGGAAILLVAGWLWPSGGARDYGATFTSRRGTLTIKILEGGSIEAADAQEIRSEIRGGQGTKILKIVEEGYQVTEQDVKAGKVLVELDSSDLKQRIVSQYIQFQSTLADYNDAQQAFDIQGIQNQTDVKAAEQKARFARMDFEKFLGDDLADSIIAKLKLQLDTNEIRLPDIDAFLGEQTAGATNAPLGTNMAPGTDTKWLGNGNPTEPGKTNGTSETQSAGAGALDDLSRSAMPVTTAPPIDFSQYAKLELLGDGAAKQQLRKLMDDAQLAKAQESLGNTKLDGTQRLFDKGFVPKSELDSETFNTQNNVLRVKTSETALELFVKYEFTKQAEELLSKYDESLRGHQRARKEAIAKLAQVRARLKSAEGRFKIEAEQRRDLNEQLNKCVIRAQKSGLVVYASDNRMFGSEQTREGATVRERQRIITIPDMKKMSVSVKIHEASIKQIKKGQPAKIRVDAYPDEELRGEVSKVGVLPDYQNRWFNPDLKVYETMVEIRQERDWLKPGMSAKVEIYVKELTNVVYVPLQAVSLARGKHLCQVLHFGRAQVREITIGDANDEFVEIKSGLAEGEKVMLRAPDTGRPEEENQEKTGEKTAADPASKEAPAAQSPAEKKPPAPGDSGKPDRNRPKAAR